MNYKNITSKNDEHIEQIIRVNQAGEFGAKRIYEGIDRVLRKFTGKGVEFYGYVRKDEKLPLSIKEGFLLLDKNRKTKYSQDVFSFAEFLATGKRKAQKTNFWQKFFNNLIKIKED